MLDDLSGSTDGGWRRADPSAPPLGKREAKADPAAAAAAEALGRLTAELAHSLPAAVVAACLPFVLDFARNGFHAADGSPGAAAAADARSHGGLNGGGNGIGGNGVGARAAAAFSPPRRASSERAQAALLREGLVAVVDAFSRAERGGNPLALILLMPEASSR